MKEQTEWSQPCALNLQLKDQKKFKVTTIQFDEIRKRIESCQERGVDEQSQSQLENPVLPEEPAEPAEPEVTEEPAPPLTKQIAKENLNALDFNEILLCMETAEKICNDRIRIPLPKREEGTVLGGVQLEQRILLPAPLQVA